MFPFLSHVLVWNFACLQFKLSIQLFFFPFLLFGYFRSVDACVVCIVSGGCNQSFSALFYVVFKLLYQCCLQYCQILRDFLIPACSDSVNHNQVQVLSMLVLLLACCQDWTCNLQMTVVWSLSFRSSVKVPVFDKKHPKKTGGQIGWNVVNIIIKVSKVGDLSRWWPKGSLFNSYYTEV